MIREEFSRPERDGMAWQDRPYAADPYGRRTYYGSGMSTRSVTTTLIVINVVVYFVMFGSRFGQALADFALMQAAAVWHGQLWRLFTATYLHASGTHIFFNMLGLYFFGPALERVWGPRQFFLAYTAGGIAGNVLITLAGVVGLMDPYVPGLGASGSVLTLLGAAAVLFPDAQILVYFLFPVRVRTFVLVYGAWFVWNVLHRGPNYGGDLAHLGGLAVGLIWAYSGGVSLSGRHRARPDPASLLGKARTRLGGGPPPIPRFGELTWEQRQQQRAEDAHTVERILAKIHEQGIASLTEAERQALAEATARRRAEEARWSGGGP
jgi:membrane associated rhomboid family serine protease